MRAKEQNGLVTVKALVKHPMETGQRKAKDGSLVPAHFIQQITAKANGEVVLEAQWSPAVSKILTLLSSMMEKKEIQSKLR